MLYSKGYVIALCGFSGKFLMKLATFFMTFVFRNWNSYWIIPAVSMLCTVVIAVGFLVQFFEDREVSALNLFELFAVSFVAEIFMSEIGLVREAFGGTVCELVLEIVTVLCFVLWASKIWEKSHFAACLLGGACVWFALSYFVLFGIFNLNSLYVPWALVTTLFHTVPMIAVFYEMRI